MMISHSSPSSQVLGAQSTDRENLRASSSSLFPEKETVVKAVPNEENPCGLNLHSAAHHCMSNVVTDLMILLTVKSQFVQHLAVKVLALTSKFLFTMGNYLNEFIQFLCCFWEVAIAGSGDENKIDLSVVRFLSPYELKRCDWSTVAGINQVLRDVIKCLKEDYDDELVKVHYDSVNSCLSKLLCSLVDQNDFVETGGAYANEHPLLVTVVNLVPRLLKWCLNKKGDTAETCIIQYLKHKLLASAASKKLEEICRRRFLYPFLEGINVMAEVVDRGGDDDDQTAAI
ncbi:hypothetical protein K1719_005155 [Acacia pycnantha]|nr:hypothetical protein K1719_005155 [Acacia pycnantha]